MWPKVRAGRRPGSPRADTRPQLWVRNKLLLNMVTFHIWGQRRIIFPSPFGNSKSFPQGRSCGRPAKGTFRLFFHESRVMSTSHSVLARLDTLLAPRVCPASAGGDCGPAAETICFQKIWEFLGFSDSSAHQWSPETALGVLRSYGREEGCRGK